MRISELSIGGDETVLTKTSLHAVRALAILAGLPRGHRLGSAALAAEIDAPPNYLGKLLQNLARQGVVDSQKGSGGGFALARDPRSIRLVDVLESLEATSRWGGCFLGRPQCSDESPCAIHHRWAELRDAYLALLSETTIAQLIRHDHDTISAPDEPRLDGARRNDE